MEAYSCKVNHRGEVSMSIKLRVSTACEMNPELYPFDVQECSIQISTPGMSKDFLELLVDKWAIKNRVLHGGPVGYTDTYMNVLENVFYDNNPAWDFLGYKFEDVAITGNDGKQYSRVQDRVET